MSLVIRGNRAYEYRSVRRGGKVTSEYVGGGSLPAECVAIQRRTDDRQRAKRAGERAAWEAERCRLVEIERQAVDVDAAYDGLATVALLATGNHRPQRGRWRRRRTMANQVESKPACRPLPTAAEIGAMLDRLDRARAEGEDDKPLQQAAWDAIQALRVAAESGDPSSLPALRVILDRRPGCFRPIRFDETAFDEAAALTSGSDLLGREITAREIRAMRDELAGPEASTLERLIAERVALAWYDTHRVDLLNGRNELVGCSQDRAEFLSRQRSRSQARFLAAAKSLVAVRRMALPVLHLHAAETPPVSPAMNERLRVLACDQS